MATKPRPASVTVPSSNTCQGLVSEIGRPSSSRRMLARFTGNGSAVSNCSREMFDRQLIAR
ncbi:hypothetical protein D3C75_1336230 [compost metagenome]